MPPTISLRPVTPDNYDAIVDMQVHEDQQNFVAPNVHSLAQACVFPDRHALAIYADETPVGFLMYGFVQDRQEFWLVRLMIAAGEQGKGYGKAAMGLLVDLMRALPGCDKIFLSYEPQNQFAREFYQRFGFVITGELFEGEEVACLHLE